MAFAVRHLSVLAYANGFTLWHYKAAHETLQAVAVEDYFSGSVDLFNTGDIIMVSAADGARIVTVKLADIQTVILGSLV
jgi:hypothetical protein